ncbi:hypothetical protein [Streptomyces rhizosphaericus]|uniref:hypothetical protein n=1 Tax=Streptomyces rhizosphaericus TaxID=114699 RepID=UPI000A3B6C11|nr:hypothetical protein [Streptomyces rhizosphaericus]
MESKKPPAHKPKRLLQLQEGPYTQALMNVIEQTGCSHSEAAYLVQRVLAAVLLAPREIVAEEPDTFQELPSPLPEECPWGCLRPDGRLVLCGFREGDRHIETGRHDTHGMDGIAFWETDPRTIHVPTWRGEA